LTLGLERPKRVGRELYRGVDQAVTAPESLVVALPSGAAPGKRGVFGLWEETGHTLLRSRRRENETEGCVEAGAGEKDDEDEDGGDADDAHRAAFIGLPKWVWW
jgi:hypothetical protein